MWRKTAALFCACMAVAGLGVAEEEPLPFSMPVPEGWRTETIPFPLSFAPELPYEGLEELRFSPGMFEDGSEELWSYAFIWWVGPSAPNDAAALSVHLEAYFRGLAAAVAESREIAVGDAEFEASLEAGEDDAFHGVAETFDAFVTRGQVRLNVRGEVLRCPAQDRLAIFFALSPQDTGHAVWSRLNSIGEGFRCGAPRSPRPAVPGPR